MSSVCFWRFINFLSWFFVVAAIRVQRNASLNSTFITLTENPSRMFSLFPPLHFAFLCFAKLFFFSNWLIQLLCKLLLIKTALPARADRLSFDTNTKTFIFCNYYWQLINSLLLSFALLLLFLSFDSQARTRWCARLIPTTVSRLLAAEVFVFRPNTFGEKKRERYAKRYINQRGEVFDGWASTWDHRKQSRCEGEPGWQKCDKIF